MEMKIPITKSKKKFGVNNFTVRNMNPLSHNALNTQTAVYKEQLPLKGTANAFSKRQFPKPSENVSISGMQA